MALKPKMTAARVGSVPFRGLRSVRLSPRDIDVKNVFVMQINLLLLNWYLLGVEMSFGHAHKARFWYLLGVFSKFSDEHPRHFYRGVAPPPRPPGVS